MTASHAHGGRRARRRAVIRAAPPHGRAEPAMHDLATWFGRTLGEFRRRRVFRVAAAYLVFGWLLLQVADATFEPLGLPAWSQRVLIFAVAAGFVLACVLAWIYDYTAGRVVRTPPMPVAAAGAEVVAQAAGAVAAPAAQGGSSVAILPFTDLSPEHDQDWFCDGLAEEIINAMCCVRGLRVASRTASFRFRDGSVDPREIGRLLAVEAILEGSVRKAGDRVRVTAQLIGAGDGYHLWSETWERRMEDIFAIQDEIARKVAQALKRTLAGEAEGRSERYAPRNLEAYEFYLRGRQLAGQTTVRAWHQAPPMFRRAIALDPDYAQAHAGLADILSQLILWRYVVAAEVLPEARAAAQRALELAPALAEAHVAHGNVLSLAGDAAAATRAFEHAIELNPELYEAYYYLGRHCFARGEQARAAQMFEAAHRVRPDEYTVLALAVSALDASGRAGHAREVAAAALPGLLRQVELEPDNPRAKYFAALMHQRLGDTAAGVPLVEAALRLRPEPDFAVLYNAACFYAIGGDSQRALDLLERAIDAGVGHPGWIEHDTDLATLREQSRFKELLARLR